MKGAKLTHEQLDDLGRAVVVGVMDVLPRIVEHVVAKAVAGLLETPLAQIRTEAAAGAERVKEAAQRVQAQCETLEPTVREIVAEAVRSASASLDLQSALTARTLQEADAELTGRVDVLAGSVEVLTTANARMRAECDEIEPTVREIVAGAVRDASAVGIEHTNATAGELRQEVEGLSESVGVLTAAAERVRAQCDALEPTVRDIVAESVRGATVTAIEHTNETARHLREADEALTLRLAALADLCGQIDTRVADLGNLMPTEPSATRSELGLAVTAAHSAVNEARQAAENATAALAGVVASKGQQFDEQLAGLVEALAKLQTTCNGVCDDVTSIDGRLPDIIRHCEERIAASLAAGPKGEPGDRGPPGEPGTPGRDGYDATFTQPVPYKAGRMFARGAVVQHRNALWYANSDTDREPGEAMSGYTLIVDGPTAQSIEADASGFLHLRTAYASGHAETLALGFRPMLPRGVYDDVAEYLANDVVTVQGSMWLAKRASCGARPGTDAGAAYWQLIVKSGKAGKDGRDGRDGKDGRGFNARGKYDKAASYAPGDCVNHAEALYCCVQPSGPGANRKAPDASRDWVYLLGSLVAEG